MEGYKLQSDEVALFEGSVKLKGSSSSNVILLTNLNIVVETINKKIFKKAESSLLVYHVTDIKVYNNQPQIKQKSYDVSVSLEDYDLLLTFDSIFTARKFASKAIELVTGKTMSARGAGKVKSAINLVDDTLGIDTMGTLTGIMENGVVKSFLGGAKKKESKITANSGTINTVANVTTELIGTVSDKNGNDSSSTKSQEMSYDEKINAVKKLKGLLDMGAISQEEFDTKMKELLGL